MFDKFLTLSYWQELLMPALEWLIGVLPKLALTLFLFYVSTKLIRLLLNRFQKRLYKRYSKTKDREKKKRVVTLTELLKSTLVIIMYTVFTLILLGELGFNIGKSVV